MIFNFIKKRNNTVHFQINTKDHIKRLSFFCYALNNKNIDIITSDNSKIIQCSKNKIILPSFINIFNNTEDNLSYLFYLITYFSYINDLNIALKNNFYNTLATIILIKTIRYKIKNEQIKFKNIETKLFNNFKNVNINKKYTNTIINILLNKLTYNKNTLLILNKNEKKLIYKIENITYIHDSNFNIILTKIKDIIDKEYNINTVSIDETPWGILINESNLNNTYYDNIKKNIKNVIKKIKQVALISKKKIIKKNKTDTNNLSNAFEYKKAIDKYEKQNKKNVNTTEKNVINKLSLDNLGNTTRYQKESKYLIQNDITALNKETESNVYNKYDYKEWDCKINKYKTNWCKIFEKTLHRRISKKDKIKYNIFTTLYKKEINILKKTIERLLNKKRFIRSKDGQQIDLDAIIDNYTYIKNSTNTNKLYQYKSKKQQDMYFLILFDSSMSTDAYLNKQKTIELIKDLTLVLALSIETLVKYEIATFHSNTRHDCRYYKIKENNEKLLKKAHILLDTDTKGYTRIGPALRHAINILKKVKTKKKLIILITDGTPTDYDEYEGEYGTKDIKAAIQEANKLNIHIKSIITNKEKKIYLKSMLGASNYIHADKISAHTLIKIFKNII